MSSVRPEDVRHLGELMRARSGLVVTDDQAYLVESRLTPLARRLGIASLADLLSALRQRTDDALVEAVTEAMATSETSFFRDGHPFELLRRVMLPRLLTARAAVRRLRIWSAAAATGQEAYSVLFCLQEAARALEGWQVEVVGTDLSAGALERARAGIYSHFEIQRGLPVQLLVRHFEQVGADWRVKPEMRRRVTFEKHNLLDDGARLGRFDIVLLRNVLIYFDADTRRRVLNRLAQALAADGYLVLGATETASGLTDGFAQDPENRGLWRPTSTVKDLPEASGPWRPSQPAYASPTNAATAG